MSRKTNYNLEQKGTKTHENTPPYWVMRRNPGLPCVCNQYLIRFSPDFSIVEFDYLNFEQ